MHSWMVSKTSMQAITFQETVDFVNHLAFRGEVRTSVFAMLKTVRVGGGLYGCSLKLRVKLLVIVIFLKI